MTNFETMLKMMWDMQVPIITVESVDENVYGDRWSVTNHIVVPNGKDKITDICFVDGNHSDRDYLVSIKHLDMDLMTALVEFSKKALASQGGKLTFYSN